MKQTVFIDELPPNNNDIGSAIMFLRNLCRVVTIPTFVSGTDSRVVNMIGRPGSSFGSRTEPNSSKPWVNINVETSKGSLKSFAKIVKFKKHNEESSSSCLASFIPDNSNEIDYVNLLDSIYGRDVNALQLDYFKKIAEFLILQSKKSLPGIISLAFTHLLKLLPKCSDPKILWSRLAKTFTFDISKRKRNLTGKDCLLASSHILTFPSENQKSIVEGAYSANLVENHLFQYGTRDDKTFQLILHFEDDEEDDEDEDEADEDDEDDEDDVYEDRTKLILTRNGKDYIDKCYFPELNEDFFRTFACLNMWNLGVINKEKRGKKRWTLASIYEDYSKLIRNYKVGVDKTVHNSFAFELLSYWSICRASHLNVNGETGGVSAFWEFVKNLQKSKGSNGNTQTIKFKKNSQLNNNLKEILEKIKIPYLMRLPSENGVREETRTALKAYLGDFIEIGETTFPRDKFGWDVTFDMKFNGVPKTGLIECKFRAQAIGYAGFFHYYKKQCETGGESPLAFLVCRKLGNELSQIGAETKLQSKLFKVEVSPNGNEIVIVLEAGENENISKRIKIEKNLNDQKLAEETEAAVANEKEPSKAENVDYIALLKTLWTDPNNQIDIYTVKYSESSRKGSFTVSPLKTFSDPKGAFILVESNFSPPASTKKN